MQLEKEACVYSYTPFILLFSIFSINIIYYVFWEKKKCSQNNGLLYLILMLS